MCPPFTHCSDHSLNLAASDTITGSKGLKEALEITHELVKLIKYSPCRERLFHEVKGELGKGNPGLHVLCPTRWTVCADSMASVIRNYAIMQAMWKDVADRVRDTDTKARIRGIAAQMEPFEFFFEVVLGEMLLHHKDNLSRPLQNKCSTIHGIRSDTEYDLFQESVTKITSDLDINETKLPKK